MKLQGKKIWIDVEEPKTGIMFKSLFQKFLDAGAELLITARDFDSTHKIMDDVGIKYIKVGKHGGADIQEKLKTYIDRLADLFPIITKENPDFLVTFGSVEGTRIAYGLQIPSIGFSDEPRSVHVSKLYFPYIGMLITPDCIPIEQYNALHATNDRIIRYNGIDEVAWLRHYQPNPDILNKFNVEPGKFVLMRSEPTFACYFVDKLQPDETFIAKYFPKMFKACPDQTYFLLVRTEGQERWLKEQLKEYLPNEKIRITRYLPNIVDLCFYASIVVSGGGTIVRESAMLNVPSIEYFPGESAPQEIWLIENGFPMEHLRETDQIISRCIELIQKGPGKDRFTDAFKKRIMDFEDPNQICYNYVVEKLTNIEK
ncbi:hypothetical protein NEF87_003614 [Candidatus Lokiarchaeum ossiferum]|uniref:DUF354 domain-containing protein n=1 Tax=Candidatus Lokiarchaeum ossiferum TaxID=2951803 RepID=A0ABY6HXQ1_9ARCH|nr:hypothetical protein NEF87_003614 [Candidatus Lokiarchaeum sp. B-35]